MVKPLPKWIMYSYAELWRSFKQNEFNHSQAQKILKQNTSVIISFLKKSGWLTIQLNPSDSRKRIYVLKDPEKVVLELANEE